MSKFKVAAVQWAPAFYDLQAGLDKAGEAIREAARGGASMVVFPETWLQGYPYWASISVRDSKFDFFRKKLNNCSISRNGESMKALCSMAAEAEIAVVMGFNEIEGGTLYNSAAYIAHTGELLRVHRKLIPTTTERLVWGRGDGSDLEPVETVVGVTGGLICFEHQMSPARMALCSMGVQVHAALWPGHAFIDGVIDASTRHLAHENACFVIVAREVMDHTKLTSDFPDVSDDTERWSAHGGSAVIGPNGAYIIEPVFDQETIVFADIDLDMIMDAKWWFDGAGHYTRPDVFNLQWNHDPKPGFCRIGDAD